MKKLNRLKYDKVNILAKCNMEQTYQMDMLYKASTTDRVINGTIVRFVNFWFNPKPFGDEEVYSSILNRILEKNSYMNKFKIKSLEVNFDYSTELTFERLQILAKVITEVLGKKGYKTLNINANIVGFNYKNDEFTNRYKSYKWFKYKSKNAKHKQLEVKLYQKADGVNRFEIIFNNNDSRLFKTLDDGSIVSGTRIKSIFQQIYNDIYTLLEKDKKLWNDEAIFEFMNAYCIALENDIEQVA